MAEKLLRLVREVEAEKGIKGRSALCAAIGKSERTLLRWIQHGVPSAHDAFMLALACGKNKREALALACECFPEEARETA